MKNATPGNTLPLAFLLVPRGLFILLAESPFLAPIFLFTDARGGRAGGRQPQVASSLRITANVAKNVLRCSPQANTRKTSRRPLRTI